MHYGNQHAVEEPGQTIFFASKKPSLLCRSLSYPGSAEPRIPDLRASYASTFSNEGNAGVGAACRAKHMKACQAQPAKYSYLPNFGFAVSNAHPGQEGGDSRIVTARGSGCGGRGQCCARLAGAVKRSRVAPMARTRQPNRKSRGCPRQ